MGDCLDAAENVLVFELRAKLGGINFRDINTSHTAYALCILALTNFHRVRPGVGINTGASTAALEFIYGRHFLRLADANCLQCPAPVVTREEKESGGSLG